MSTLFQLTQQDAELYAMLDGDDEISDDQLYSILESSLDSINIKAARVIAVIKQLRHDADGHSAIAKHHSAKAKARNNDADRLADYLIKCMDNASLDKCGTLEHCAKIPKPRASLKIDDADLLPSSFKIIVEQVQIDNAALKKALESGAVIGGAHLEYKKTLRIE